MQVRVPPVSPAAAGRRHIASLDIVVETVRGSAPRRKEERVKRGNRIQFQRALNRQPPRIYRSKGRCLVWSSLESPWFDSSSRQFEKIRRARWWIKTTNFMNAVSGWQRDTRNLSTCKHRHIEFMNRGNRSLRIHSGGRCQIREVDLILLRAYPVSMQSEPNQHPIQRRSPSMILHSNH